MSEANEYKGYEIKIVQDIDPTSPREWDNLGLMVFERNTIMGDINDTCNEITRMVHGNCVKLSVYAYKHSGVCLSTDCMVYPFNDMWDAGQIGYIYADYDRICENFQVDQITEELIARTKVILKGEIETYNQYLAGDVYGYIITKVHACSCGECSVTDELDSCWGFYGYENALKQAQEIVDYYIDNQKG